MKKPERRQSMAERRPSVSVIPHLAGLEKPQDNSLKLDHVDVLILGTGLTESIIAAALSWQGVEVLHVDDATYYGDHLSTLTIDQIKKWSLEVNHGKIRHFRDAQVYIPGGKTTNKFNSKDYGIDLSPKLMFAKLDLLLLLVKSRVYKYLEFQSLSNFHVFENDNFNKNISSTTKGDIFTDQTLSLHTKRYLMKFLKFVLQDNNEEAKLKVLKENANVPIEEFLSKTYKLDTPQINELIFSIGLCNRSNLNTPEALMKIKRFLISFDVYGNFPVMVLKYGGPGEISQGFCRSAAVAGTTYKLNTSLVDFDPELKIAKFNDNSKIKINEKIIISPTQIPKFLNTEYQQQILKLPLYTITRLISIVKKDCNEWMSEHESLAIVVFPPFSLPTENKEAVQVIIQNGRSGVCPEGQSIWYSHTTEQNIPKAKDDLQAAFEKMESSLLREMMDNDLEDVVGDKIEDKDFIMNAQGTPVLLNSFKLGKSLQNFVPKEKLEIVCKIGYIQETLVNPDLSNVLQPSQTNNISLRECEDSPDIIFTNMPASELSYDGVVTDCKSIYSRITGTDEDFFDIDFEDEDEDEERQQYSRNNVVASKNNDASSSAIADSDDEDIHDDHHHHEPFGAEEMEL